MDISSAADILGIIGFFVTLLTFIAALNVRSKIVHLKEREEFRSNFKQIEGKLNGYILSVKDNKLDSSPFYMDIDIYMTHLPTRYTFFGIMIKIKCKYISYILNHKNNDSNFDLSLAKQLTDLLNLISKEEHT